MLMIHSICKYWLMRLKEIFPSRAGFSTISHYRHTSSGPWYQDYRDSKCDLQVLPARKRLWLTGPVLLKPCLLQMCSLFGGFTKALWGAPLTWFFIILSSFAVDWLLIWCYTQLDWSSKECSHSCVLLLKTGLWDVQSVISRQDFS